MKYSLFKNYTDTKPTTHLIRGWDEFVSNMADLCVWRDANEVTKKRHTPAISPAVYENGDMRRNTNVTGWGGWTALDVDNDLMYTPIEDAISVLDEMGLNYLLYSTTKAKPQHHRYRIMMPLSRELEADEISLAWKSIVQFFAIVGPDAACKDTSRIYGVPSFFAPVPDGNEDPHNCFEFRLDGCALDIDWVLAKYVPEPEREHRDPVPVPLNTRATVSRDDHPEARKQIPYGSTIFNSPVVASNFVADYLNLGKGAHHVGLYTFMARVAGRAKAKGYSLDAMTLVEYAREIDGICPIKTNRERWRRISYEAESAIRFASR